MIKLSSPTDWDFGGPSVTLIKSSSRGLIGSDRAKLIKLAGEEVVRAFDNVKIAAGEEPLLVLALGEFNNWGANRNGDAFYQDVCRDYHDTFRKHAKWFRWHNNKQDSPSYGTVKASAFNEAMQRIDLIVGLNTNKIAAERNGGFIADKEMEKLARGEDLPVSMACTIPFDKCSACGNEARHRAEYCTEATCKAGGCQENIGKLVKLGNDMHHLHVINYRPRWFDISLVGRPADRTAYAGKASWFSKDASDKSEVFNPTLMSAPLDLMVLQLTDGISRTEVREQVKMAYLMQQLDEQNFGYLKPDVLRAFANREHVDLSFLGKPGTKTAQEGIAALVEQKIVLPLCEFARWTSRGELVKQATSLLPGVYGRMLGDGSLASQLASSAYSPADRGGEMSQRRAAFHIKQAFGLDEPDVRTRCWRSCVRREEAPTLQRSRAVKTASEVCLNTEVDRLARDYALYQLGSLHKIASFDSDLVLTVRLSMSQNHI
jgi:hypothetical protein